MCGKVHGRSCKGKGKFRSAVSGELHILEQTARVKGVLSQETAAVRAPSGQLSMTAGTKGHPMLRAVHDLLLAFSALTAFHTS